MVVLIHGIRTRGEWCEMVRDELEAKGIKSRAIGLGEYFDVFRFLCPIGTRKRQVRRVLAQIDDVQRIYRGAKISVIAHSFGTYVFSQILKKTNNPDFHRVILCGGIVSEKFPWMRYEARLEYDRSQN
ncbi:MAG: hypothetical protein KDM63_01900, partial [Verrucomicrobiae bacterium]|nr:hypothetical protein [Verrucomicrobiae bacterium]